MKTLRSGCFVDGLEITIRTCTCTSHASRADRHWPVSGKLAVPKPKLRAHVGRACVCVAPASGMPQGDASDTADVECVAVGERTREQRDAEGRKRAIDLDGGPAGKAPRTEGGLAMAVAHRLVEAVVARRPRGGDGGTVPGVDAFKELASLVEDFPAHIQAAAVRWCEENEAWSVRMIVEGEADD